MSGECPNCGTDLLGAYCHGCGQAADARPHDLRRLIDDAADSLFDFDARFYRSLRALLGRPGALSVAWSEGRRASFTGPVRLYLLASVVYFVAVSATGSLSALFVNFEPGQEELAGAFQNVMIFLVPLYGLCLGLSFRTSERLYVEHLVVALHLHAAWYLILVLDVLLQWAVLRWMSLESPLILAVAAVQIALRVVAVMYTFRALRQVYGRGRFGTGLRMGVSIFLYLALMLPVVLAYIYAMQGLGLA